MIVSIERKTFSSHSFFAASVFSLADLFHNAEVMQCSTRSLDELFPRIVGSLVSFGKETICSCCSNMMNRFTDSLLKQPSHLKVLHYLQDDAAHCHCPFDVTANLSDEESSSFLSDPLVDSYHQSSSTSNCEELDFNPLFEPTSDLEEEGNNHWSRSI
jgi:hypothetical protein